MVDEVKLLKSDIKKYRELYLARFGAEIDDQVAYSQLTLLVRQLQIVYRPITNDQLVKQQTMNMKSSKNNDD